MNREEALIALRDRSATSRVRAARALVDHAIVSDLPTLRSARESEDDTWTQKALDRAIARIATGTRARPRSTTRDRLAGQDGIKAVRAQALQIATKQVLHEVRPQVQSIDRAARIDLGELYETSETYAAVGRIGALLRALQALGEAADSPRNVEFDLTETIRTHVSHAGLHDNQVLLARADPALVQGDPALVALAFANLLRNAVDASADDAAPVIVNWGANESSAWISVLDEGEGLPVDGITAAFDVGTTTRNASGHFGLGLPIAAQAMSSLGGAITLRPRKRVGTAAEAKWPQ